MKDTYCRDRQLRTPLSWAAVSHSSRKIPLILAVIYEHGDIKQRSGEEKAPKPYAQYDFETQKRPNLTHSMVLRPEEDPEAPKPYAQHGFETRGSLNLTHSMI